MASAVTVMSRFAVFVCISALCRRYRTALAACYGFAFLWPVVIQAASLAVHLRSSNDAFERAILLNLAAPLLILAALAVLLRRALQAIAEPGGVDQPPRRAMRIMDCGAEEPDDERR
jgi:hypothetical protein